MSTYIKKDLQKQRTMRYFIDATNAIAKTEGIEKITIRNVAERAGYNSATLYNYFDNLDQLIAFAMIDSVTEYLIGFDRILNSDIDPLIAFLLSWKLYAECSFLNPGAYAYVFSSPNSDYALANLERYFDAFPATEKTLNKIVTSEDMITRNRLLIAPCVRAGYFDESEQDYITDFCYILHGGFSNRISNRDLMSKDAVPLFLDYLTEFIGHHLKRQGAQLPTTDDLLKLSY